MKQISKGINNNGHTLITCQIKNHPKTLFDDLKEIRDLVVSNQHQPILWRLCDNTQTVLSKIEQNKASMYSVLGVPADITSDSASWLMCEEGEDPVFYKLIDSV